jgi:hypothetical protein
MLKKAARSIQRILGVQKSQRLAAVFMLTSVGGVGSGAGED